MKKTDTHFVVQTPTKQRETIPPEKRNPESNQ
jgi:hypothetical protein